MLKFKLLWFPYSYKGVFLDQYIYHHVSTTNMLYLAVPLPFPAFVFMLYSSPSDNELLKCIRHMIYIPQHWTPAKLPCFPLFILKTSALSHKEPILQLTLLQKRAYSSTIQRFSVPPRPHKFSMWSVILTKKSKFHQARIPRAQVKSLNKHSIYKLLFSWSFECWKQWRRQYL